MHNTPHSLRGKARILFGTLVFTTLAGCVDYPGGSVGVSSGYRSSRYSPGYASGYGYGYAGLNSPGNYHYYPRYRTYYSPQSRQYYYQTGSSWQVRSSPYGVSSRTLLSSPHVPLNLRGSPADHHSRVTQSYPSDWSPSARDHEPRSEPRYDAYRRYTR